MATLKRFLLAPVLTVVLFSCLSVLAQDTSNLEMSNAKLNSQTSISFNPRFTAERSGRDYDDYPFNGQYVPPRGANERVIYQNGLVLAKVSARNTSAKTIKSVTWEYSFFSDAQMTQPLRSYQLYSKQKIRAGETKSLKGKVITPFALPAQTHAALNSTPHKTVRPLRIEYTDGTVWEAH